MSTPSRRTWLQETVVSAPSWSTGYLPLSVVQLCLENSTSWHHRKLVGSGRVREDRPVNTMYAGEKIVNFLFRPDPTQSNPSMDPIHCHLCRQPVSKLCCCDRKVRLPTVDILNGVVRRRFDPSTRHVGDMDQQANKIAWCASNWCVVQLATLLTDECVEHGN